MFAFLQNAVSGGTMTPAEAITRSAANEVVLIDIRDPMEIRASGKAKGALEIPSSTLAMRADPRSPECLPELKQGKPIAVYCASGARSSMARMMLKRMGHDEVHNIGGLVHWQQAGGEITR
ncbi:rhodanese-like domain-containing protein [Tropicibacter oceani]|uniref:Rhodanese-like domain-containing protein n=1 Tax=Tropicibacter oceani TaxID=3058420 RepID=A0ABY8QEK7_9RHOB|nr:rhodanese-like domain-containing protein [Tropicibacter oceani]WGW03030.1 rhodanese-like domain-containing protein [Tropicibacter oceani]